MNLREKLMSAVIECLNEGDLKACTVKKIAAKAGVNHGMVHYCFGSKEQMFVDALLNTKKSGPLHYKVDDREKNTIKSMVEECTDSEKCTTKEGHKEAIIEHFNSMPISNLFIELMMLSNDMPNLQSIIEEIVQARVEEVNEMTDNKDRDRAVIIISALIGLLVYKRLDKGIDVARLQRKIVDIAMI